ncbi:hypothetical protein HDF12_000492 [Edaphobacter lichenicola]|uniref:Uncharacterized protein n=1 Tax=Tunturiibacter lichenicola TaxID=2051959 RepID=A0A7Y9T1K3_9BACT|nr:hypothetical protein [Edaphobacter lichenicola]
MNAGSPSRGVRGGQWRAVYLVFNPMKSLADDDHGLGDEKKFTTSLSEGEPKKLRKWRVSCVESSPTNLFAFNPKICHPDERWGKRTASGN